MKLIRISSSNKTDKSFGLSLPQSDGWKCMNIHGKQIDFKR